MGLLDKKSTIITGAASGIGRAAALAFGEAGAYLILADVEESGGEQTAALVREAGGTAKFVRTNVAVEADVVAMVAAAVESYGALHCAFNNAGITTEGVYTADMSLDSWNRMLSINLTGVFLCVKHELRAMLAADGGAIVNTSSGLGIVGLAGSSAYAATKAGILSLTRCAAIEYARKNIRVNAVLPGATNTGMAASAPPGLIEAITSNVPIGRLGEPREIAAAALWLLSEAASFVTASSMVADGGHSAM